MAETLPALLDLLADDDPKVAAAARALGVNHATVLRRIAEFETRTGVQMFNRTTRGYQISPDRRAVVEAELVVLGRDEHTGEHGARI